MLRGKSSKDKIEKFLYLFLFAFLIVYGCSPSKPGATPTIVPTPEEKTTSTLPEAAAALDPSSEEKTTSTMTEASAAIESTAEEETMPTTPSITSQETISANIYSLDVSGDPGAYHFSVGVLSQDLGCEQFADWWEVIDEQGELKYRRILLHSHAGEQPFVRSGGPVPIAPEDIVVVRAHMHPSGYGGIVFKGSIQTGFQEFELSPDFASELENSPPLPEGCAF
ncbi:hypothetical protein ACFLV7_07510 [Chloroflexota bacterium]